MISKWEVKNFIKKNPDKFPYIYKEEEDALYDKETKEYLASLDTFLDFYRKKSGESFECIYNEHVSLFSVLKCTECGTVIFTYDDERYDPYLKCPVCTEYKTHFKYWTADEIEKDVFKKRSIEWYEEMTQQENEAYERRKRRGKYDWQIAVKKFYGKKYYLGLSLECNNITESYFKGLRLQVSIGEKDDSETGYDIKKSFTIPLSWSQFYTQFIYKHLGKCHPDFRSKWYIGRARKR